MSSDQIICHSLNNHSASLLCQDGLQYTAATTTNDDQLDYHSQLFWIYLGIFVFLTIFGGICSGLSLGLLSLDKTSLRVLAEAGTPSARRHAKRILPLVERHHLLLVTLLLANAMAVEAMPLFLDRISNPAIALGVSVSAVLLFGDVLPQALCSRFGLAIGATLTPLVYLLMAVFFVVAWPLARLLDVVLGREHATFYRRAELKALVGLHGPESRAQIDSDATDAAAGSGDASNPQQQGVIR